MNDEKAKEILGDAIEKDGGLFSSGHYMAYEPGDDVITLDCQFTFEELEAIAYWMRKNYEKTP